MGLHMPAEPRDFEPIPAGTQLAICFRIIELGSQKKQYAGDSWVASEIMISWEVPEHKMDDGRPMMISKTYTLSSSKKSNLRKDLESWRAKAFTSEELASFDLTKLLGKPCLLAIQHVEKEGNVYANIANVSPPVKGMAIPLAHNAPNHLGFANGSWNQSVFDGLSDKMKAKIHASPEYQAMKSGTTYTPSPTREMLDDEIPF